jgi:tRNA A-37 threonylcarbamoyl transferase component Bud32
MIGRVVGNYRIDALLGEGGMARVYRAYHTSLDREVAIKVLRPDVAADPAVKARFLREQEALDRLRHPSIVGLHDVCSVGPDLFLIMELVEGETLRERVQRAGPMSIDQACEVTGWILAGLAVAHNAGVLHRDIKPANIMLTDQTAKILDFGVAKAADSVALTAAGMVIGSPAYLPPERWEAEPATAATDVYGVGLCLWECLVGRPPVSPDGGWKACYKAHTEQGIPDVRESNSAIPRWLADLVSRATAKDPTARFPDAQSMLRLLEAGRAGPATYDEQRTVMLAASPESRAPEAAARVAWSPAAAAEPEPQAPGSRTRALARDAARDLARTGGPTVDAEAWQPGEMTRAFIRRARRPWKMLAVAVVVAGVLVAGGLVIRGWLIARSMSSGFALDLANVTGDPVHIACTAGEGEGARSWGVNVAPGETASIGIPQLPATCEEVLTDGSRRLVWTMPKALALGEELPELSREDENLRPEPEPGPEAVAASAPEPASRPAPKREVQVARLVVGEVQQPANTSPCEELVTLEPQAVMGTLPTDIIACLETTMSSSAPLTNKDKVSRLLIWDAEARNDTVAWERLVRRHLETVGSSDPDICMALAIRLKKKGTVSALEESIELAGTALENRSRYSGEQFVKRVNALHALRTIAAEMVWRRYENSVPGLRSEEVETQTKAMRHRTRDYAREWLDYAEVSGASTERAQAVLAEVGKG